MLTCVKSQAVKIEVCSQGGGGVKKENIKKNFSQIETIKGAWYDKDVDKVF